MDRLIVETKYGKWIKGSLTVYGDVNLLHGAFDKLFSYESTGLSPEQVAELLQKTQRLEADRDAWKRRAEAAEAEIGRLKEKVCASFEKSDQLIEDQSDFVEELQRRLSTAEKVCSAAYMYIKHINSPLCVGWDLLLDALRKWTDERRPRDEGKEGSE